MKVRKKQKHEQRALKWIPDANSKEGSKLLNTYIGYVVVLSQTRILFFVSDPTEGNYSVQRRCHAAVAGREWFISWTWRGFWKWRNTGYQLSVTIFYPQSCFFFWVGEAHDSFWKSKVWFTLGASGFFSRATGSFVGRHVFAWRPKTWENFSRVSLFKT